MRANYTRTAAQSSSCSARNHKVIEGPNVNQCQHCRECPTEHLVRPTRLRNPLLWNWEERQNGESQQLL